MKCEMLFCQHEAVAKLKAPHINPYICQACLDEQLAFYAKARLRLGNVVIDGVSPK